MYCPNCGYYNEDDAAFCGSCGMPLGQQVNAAPGSTDTVPQYEEMNGQMQEKPGAGDMLPSVPAKKKAEKYGSYWRRSWSLALLQRLLSSCGSCPDRRQRNTRRFWMRETDI